uniref:Uncharacterized protein n=1 Tax=Globodera rostochiensis TaxID=31243 RepID=A0A914H258_GLORO
MTSLQRLCVRANPFPFGPSSAYDGFIIALSQFALVRPIFPPPPPPGSRPHHVAIDDIRRRRRWEVWESSVEHANLRYEMD